MARKDALLRLHQRLVARRDFLRKKLGQQLEELPRERDVGDVGDAATDGACSELDSQLAAFETRELRLIERALELMREGRYGICEECGQRIPVARLKAVPFAPYCVKCQRRIEQQSQHEDKFGVSWEKAYEFEGQLSDREITLGDLEVER
ncbi:MAG TPA: TraR/DksA family transcriptional regulator [Planctomycetaceae bacterium]|nr:TraR/DksA family transcriptional regulator [Planctomycetaceae bacterium]